MKKYLSHNGNLLKRGTNKLIYRNYTPPVPSLPPYTLRLKFKEGVTPTFSKGTGVQVSSIPNIWDLTYENEEWNNLLFNQTDLNEVLWANTTGVITMNLMFFGCTSLTYVPLFDTSKVTSMPSMFFKCISLSSVPQFNTSSVTDMDSMFWKCTSLKSVPLFNTSNVIYIGSMFRDCTNVESGALALYQQASTQATPPTDHDSTFSNCGIDTTTGAAELAQIPDDWK